MIPKTYLITSGCHNCKHVYIRGSYEGIEEVLCTKINPIPKPKYYTEGYFNWANGREVQLWGMCEEWEQGEEFEL